MDNAARRVYGFSILCGIAAGIYFSGALIGIFGALATLGAIIVGWHIKDTVSDYLDYRAYLKKKSEEGGR